MPEKMNFIQITFQQRKICASRRLYN